MNKQVSQDLENLTYWINENKFYLNICNINLFYLNQQGSKQISP